jgi:hypothetical protein
LPPAGNCPTRLPPSRLSEIDLALIGERTGSAADGSANERTINRVTEQKPADGTHASANSGTRDGTVGCARAAGAKSEGREGRRDQEKLFHDLSPKRVILYPLSINWEKKCRIQLNK